MLPELKNDISFVDIATMKTVCTFNQCRQKFEPATNTLTKTSDFGQLKKPKTISWTVQHNICKECGREYERKKEGLLNKENYQKELDRIGVLFR